MKGTKKTKRTLPGLGLLVPTHGASRFTGKVAGCILYDRVRNLTIRENLGLEPLLLRIERIQFMWSGHLAIISPDRTVLCTSHWIETLEQPQDPKET